MISCSKNPYIIQTQHALLSLKPNSDSQGVDSDRMGTLTTWKFDQSSIRVALASMIIVDELPF